MKNAQIFKEGLSEMKHCYYSLHIADCYTHLGCYTYNVLATTVPVAIVYIIATAMPLLTSLLQVLFVRLSNLPEIPNFLFVINVLAFTIENKT